MQPEGIQNLYLLKVHLQTAAACSNKLYYCVLQQSEGELLRDKGFSCRMLFWLQNQVLQPPARKHSGSILKGKDKGVEKKKMKKVKKKDKWGTKRRRPANDIYSAEINK